MNVFDFDNTIYKGESSLHLFWFYIKRMPHLLKYIPMVFKALYKYKKGSVSIEAALCEYAPYVEKYFSVISKDADSDAKLFWDAHMHRIKPFYEDIRKHDDIIVTASPEIFMKEICSRLGVQHVIGTTFNNDTGRIERLCYRKNKVDAFREEFGDAEIDAFYTDSINDAPMIEIAKTAYLVKGNRITKIK